MGLVDASLGAAALDSAAVAVAIGLDQEVERAFARGGGMGSWYLKIELVVGDCS